MATISTYSFGERGVVLTKSPTHNEEGELSSAQNAIVDRDAREGALRKRPGLVKVNSSALAGTVRGLTHVPFANPDDAAEVTQTLYAATDENFAPSPAVSWRTSTDGTTWSSKTTPDYVVDAGGLSWVSFDDDGGAALPTAVSYNGVIYYPSNSYSTSGNTTAGGGLVTAEDPPIYSWDGTNDRHVVTVPLTDVAVPSPVANIITYMLTAGDHVYIAGVSSDNNTLERLKVFQFNPLTGVLKKVGANITPADIQSKITSMVWFLGKLWISTVEANNAGPGRVFSIRPPTDDEFDGDTSWTTEYTATGDGNVISMAVYRGRLFAGQSNAINKATTGPKIMVRSATGTFSASETGAGGASTQESFYAGLFVYKDELYALYDDNDGANSDITYRKYNGTSWSLAVNVETFLASGTSINAGVARPVIFKDNMYVAIQETGHGIAGDSFILKNASGTWSEVDTLGVGEAVDGYFLGPLAILEQRL